ncbi:hypothetical protein evm_005492 [Chilo suppressalis]|nr:hypothetical protein evm_005492 [Chilo suppressalis]
MLGVRLSSIYAGYLKLYGSRDRSFRQGVSALSELCVVGSERTQLLEEAVSQTARVLDSESHERTLCAALEALRHWATTPRVPLCAALPRMYQKNLSAKSTTQLVRIAYTSLIALGLHAGGAEPGDGAALRPLLTKAADKAVQQPTQPLVVSEGISAMLGLVALDSERALPTTGAWAALTHPTRPTILHERALAAAPDDVLIQVVLLCRTLLENYPCVASEQNSPVYKAFILVLLSPIKAVRDAALEEVKSLLANEERALLAKYLVTKLNEVLEEGKIFTSKEKTPPEEKTSDVTGKMILDCVQALCSYKENDLVYYIKPKREREQLTLRSKRTQEPPKTTVPLKRVKLTVKLPPKPEKPKPPPPPPGIKCAICRHLSKTPQANSNHLRSHTVTFTSSKLACNACREWFSDAEAAAAHHRRHEARSKAYMCRTCRARRATYKQYLAHTESGDCVPWDEVPDVQCSECWKYFPTDNLRTQHKCPGEEGRPGGKCSKCSRTYTLMKNLKKHESTCTAKKRGKVPIDPELMAKVRPIQVRTVRCDPLLERVQNGHYDISDVPENYGLDPDRVYPYINSASLNFNRMVNIKTDLLDFYCEEDYIHWDSDNSTEDEIVEKDKEVDSLTTLSLKTLFSQKCLGRVPRKKRKVKTEKSMFDSILGNDFDMSKDINSIIDNLGDDDDAETKTEDVNNDSKISDATVSVGIDSEDKDREVNVTDESANLDDSNKKVKSEDNDKVDGVSVSNDESKNNVEDESKVSGGSYDKLQVNNSEGKVQLDESSNGKPEANDKSDDYEQINDSTDDKAKINDSSDDKLSECNADGKNTNEDSVEKINDENESSKGIEVDKMEVNEKSIDKNNHETDPSKNVIESESIGDDINIDSRVSKKEENGEQHCENLDFNEKEVEKLNIETNENIKDTPDAVNVVDSTNIDKDSLRVSDVDLRIDSKENKNVPENDKNPEDKKSDENVTEASGEVSTDCDIVKSRDLTAKGADDIKETIENDIKQSVEVNDTIIPEKDKGNGVRSMETDKEDFIDSETGDKKENIEQSDLTDEHIQKPGDDNSLTNETQKINDDTVKMNGDFDGRTVKTKTDELTDSEIDDKKLMDALNEHIGETDENDVTNDKAVDADRATDKDAKAFEVKRTDEQHTYDNTHENKITLEDLVPSEEKTTPSMDLDSISDDEFNFDS